MPRVDLMVPFAEKDQAEQLGARWDAVHKTWFVPEGLDAAAFSQWLPRKVNIGIRASSYLVAETLTECWRCHELTRVYALILPAGHETLESGDDDTDSYWYQHTEAALVLYVTDLPQVVAAQMTSRSPRYRIDFSKTTQSSYWMNHCEHCGMKQGDFGLYCEPGGAFFPMDERAASHIAIDAVQTAFECNGSTAYGDQIDFIVNV